MIIRKISLLILALCFAPVAVAYNLETHAQMTQIAFDRSILRQTDLLARLGLDRLDERFPFNNQNSDACLNVDAFNVFRLNAYIDAAPSRLEPDLNPAIRQLSRCPTLFEKRSMPPEYSGLLPNSTLGTSAALRLEAWLMRGVIREDDFQFGKYDNPNLFPDRDPWLDDFRSKNHFYNPVREDTGLGPLGNNFQRSTTWALGVADSDGSWLTNQTPDPSRGNHFSYMDARKQYFLALTFKDASGSSRGPRAEYQMRTNLWATLFKSLGHVVHLLQDTASPQHASRCAVPIGACRAGFWYRRIGRAAG